MRMIVIAKLAVRKQNSRVMLSGSGHCQLFDVGSYYNYKETVMKANVLQICEKTWQVTLRIRNLHK